MRNAPDADAILRQGLRLVSIQWMIQVAVVLAIGLVTPVVVKPAVEPGAPSRLLTVIFVAVSLLDLVIAWWFKARVLPANLRKARTDAEAAGMMAGPAIVFVSLAITPAFLGLALYLTQGDHVALSILFALSLIGHWLLKPRYEEWQAMVRERGR